MTDWLSRTEMLIGAEGLLRLKSSDVLVVGLGGVGSWAAEMICRAGVEKMTIVDGDTVHTTNRNRQLLALNSTAGKLKAAVMKKIPVVSSMGSGGKFDPLNISINDISETNSCPLARILRKRLHRLGVREGITAVYSPEPVDKSKVERVAGERNKASVVGTMSYMPAAFGIACASVVIRDLADIPG